MIILLCLLSEKINIIIGVMRKGHCDISVAAPCNSMRAGAGYTGLVIHINQWSGQTGVTT